MSLRGTVNIRYEVRLYDRRGNCLAVEGFATLRDISVWLDGNPVPKAECAKTIDIRTMQERAHWHRAEKGWTRA
jgi:hypothetical protein